MNEMNRWSYSFSVSISGKNSIKSSTEKKRVTSRCEYLKPFC